MGVKGQRRGGRGGQEREGENRRGKGREGVRPLP